MPNAHAVAVAFTNEDATQVAGALEQVANSGVQPTIQCITLAEVNIELYETVTFKAANVMCPVTVQWLRPTRATVEVFRIFSFLNGYAIINGLSECYYSTSPLSIKCSLNARKRKSSGGSPSKSDLLIGPPLSRRCY